MAIYMVAMVVIGIVLRGQATKSIADFGLAANRFGSTVIAAVSIGAWVGSAGLIGLCASSYTGGVVSWWSYASLYLVTLPWIYFFASRLKALKLFTIAEFYQMRFSGYDGAIQYPVGIGFSLKYCMMMGLQFNALAFLFTTFLGWSHLRGVLVSAVIILFYTAISGFLSVMVTNFIQSIFQTLCPFLALGFVLFSLGGWQPVAQYYQAAGQPEALSLFQGFGWVKELIYYCITMGLLVIVGNQDDLQRVASAKNVKSAKRGLYLGTFLVLPILAIPCYVGAAAKVLLGPGVEPNMVFYTLMMKAGPVVGLLLLYGVLSTIMSCASSTLFAGGDDHLEGPDPACHEIERETDQRQGRHLPEPRGNPPLHRLQHRPLPLVPGDHGADGRGDVHLRGRAGDSLPVRLVQQEDEHRGRDHRDGRGRSGGPRLDHPRQTPRARCHLDRPALLPGRVPGRAEVRQGAHAGGDRRHLLFPGEIPQPPPRGKGRVLTRSRGRCVEGICFASNWERSRSLQCF